VEPIKRDLHLSDTEISLIIGFAFVSFYAIVGLPIARLVDSHSRRLILGIGIALWSGMTAMCGLAQNFWQLFAARLGVGVGEACNGPATFSLLSDLFPREKLPKAISILNIGFVSGQGISFLVGGTVIGIISALPEITVPVIGAMRPWQLTFLAVGFPGLLVAAAMLFTVKEPRRHGLIAAGEGETPGAKVKPLPVREVVRFLLDNKAAYGFMFLALGVQSIMIIGVVSWLPTFFIRQYHWSIAKFGLYQGLIMLIVAPAGLMLGARLAEYFAGKGYDDANVRVVFIAAVLVFFPQVLFPLMPNPYVALILLALLNFILALAPGPQNAAFQVITPNQVRGQITAIYIFILNIIGFGLGPVFIALITDYVFGSEAQLGHAMALAALIMEPLAALVFWLALKPYGECYARAKASWS
jgi:MFS family permease